ncbi:hypothetical protein HDV04_006217 [Boothiomyces sp. JEL0838]|nr:hypothetical protein HDV04_006217 [Boothiomyces sp. JEL0838]
MLRNIQLILKGTFNQQIRTKTFRKTPTKAYQRVMAMKKLRLALGLEVKPHEPVMENKFWKVEGDMKYYKSVSPGSTNRAHPTKFHLHKGSAVKRLSFGKRSTGGRSCHGQITVRHRGGGHKKRVRIIDFHRKAGSFQVIRYEYDPNRSAELVLLRCISTNEFSYIIRPKNVAIGQIIHSFPNGIPPEIPGERQFTKSELIQPGNAFAIKDIPVGTMIHCIGLKKGGPAQLCRSAGTSAQLMSTTPNGYAQIRLGSQEVRMIDGNAIATIGEVANEQHKLRNWGKAGARRRKGWRPAVRGIQ